MRRDTPRDETPAQSIPERADPDSALRALRAVETLEAAYGAWEELRHEQAERRQTLTQEQRRLEGEGRFLLGAVRAAGRVEPAGEAQRQSQSGDTSLATAGTTPLESFVRDAETRMTETREALAARGGTEEASFRSAFEEIERTVEERVRRYAAKAPPSLVLWRRPVGTDRSVLHLKLMSADASLVLLYLATGKIAFRHDYLTDDSTDAPDRDPPSFYGEPGDAPEVLRPSPRQYPDRVRGQAKVSRVKGFVPMFVQRSGQTELFYRFRQRGPVLEAEILDGDAFRSLLTAVEEELLAGQLLRWKLSGAIDLKLEAG